MSVLSFFRAKKSAPVARERLQIMLAHERAVRGRPDLLNVLREEILAVVAKHVEIEDDRVQVKMNRTPALSTLEIDIEIPNVAHARIAVNM